ncbi:hypothetical protein D3C87_1128520 [compost metagenome]
MDEMRQRVEAMRSHTETVNAGRQPRFGDRMRNLWAGERNPHRDATFIRVVHRSGRFNPGKWYEMTDEMGKTWLQAPEGLIFLELVEVSESVGGPFNEAHPDHKDGGANA